MLRKRGGRQRRKGSQLQKVSDDLTGQGTIYHYDEFNRLYSSNFGNGHQTFTYVYDLYGNRWQQSAPQGGSTFSQSYDATTNRINSGGYTYDAAGNMTNDGFHSYSYDAEGNILTVDGSADQYVYDALNERVQSQTGSVTSEYMYNYNGQRTSTWNAANNTGIEGVIYWDGHQFAFRSQDGTTYFDHKDWLGTERVRTDYQGNVAQTRYSLPWGDGASLVTTKSGSAQDPADFASLDLDSETTTEHAQFRNYSTAQGRWLSPDPYDGSYDVTNPQSFNRYAYVMNNPLSFTDPSGLFMLPPPPGQPDPCDENPLECYGGGSGGNGLCMWFGYCPGSQNNTGGGSTPPKPAPTQALCNSLNPPQGPINYSANAQNNAQMGLLGWYQAFKGGGTQDFKGNSGFGSPANQIAAGNFNFGASVAAKGWSLSTGIALAGAGAFISNLNAQGGAALSQAAYMQGQYGGPSSPNPSASGPAWNMGSGFPGFPSSSGNQGDQEAPNENQAVINGYVWYTIGCHS